MNKDIKILSSDICLVRIHDKNKHVLIGDYEDCFNSKKTGFYLINREGLETEDGTMPRHYQNVPMRTHEIAELAIFNPDRTKFVLVREIGHKKVYETSDFRKMSEEGAKPELELLSRISLKTCQYVLSTNTTYTLDSLKAYNSRIITTQLLEVMAFGNNYHTILMSSTENKAMQSEYADLF